MPNKHSVFDVDAQRFDDAILAEYGNLLIMAHPTLSPLEKVPNHIFRLCNLLTINSTFS